MPLIFPRLVWSSLLVALAVGSVQTGVQRWQAAPLILAAEVYEGQKVEPPALAIERGTAAPVTASAAALAPPAAAHTHAPGTTIHAHAHTQAATEQPTLAIEPVPDHKHADAKAWEPDNGAERIGWTWVANALHAFSMALLVFAVMGVWRYQRGAGLAALPLAGLVAAAGWLSFHVWPTFGLPAEVPGMESAPLHARQVWWTLAVGSAGVACALVGFGKAQWRWPLAAILLALPFVVGAPHLQGDALAGYSPKAHAALGQLLEQFFWASHWVALSFWISMGLACGLVFQRWLQPVLVQGFHGSRRATA